MRRLAVLVLFATGPGHPLSAQTDRSAELAGVERARFEAQVKRDTAALRILLADDVVYVHSNALVESKHHFLESIATGRIIYDSLAPLDMHHRIYGNTAVGNGKVRVVARLDGRTVAMDLLFSTMLVLRDKRWELVSWQSTRVP